MTPSQRLICLQALAVEHGWELTPAVTAHIAQAESLDSVERVEWVVTLASDIASIRGERLSVAHLERMLAPVPPPTNPYPSTVSEVFSAIEDGMVSELRRAISHPDANLEDVSRYHDKMTPLLLALFQRDLSMAQVLVKAGAEVQNRGGYPDAPIHLAILGPGTKRLLLLLDAGAAIDCLDGSGNSPLHLAAANDRNLDKVRVLLGAGADRNLTNATGQTSLDIARREGATAITQALESETLESSKAPTSSENSASSD